MGGMFTVMKIRADLAHGDYRDPGWYRPPAGSVAYPWDGEAPPAKRGAATQRGSATNQDSGNVPLRVRKPSGPMEH